MVTNPINKYCAEIVGGHAPQSTLRPALRTEVDEVRATNLRYYPSTKIYKNDEGVYSVMPPFQATPALYSYESADQMLFLSGMANTGQNVALPLDFSAIEMPFVLTRISEPMITGDVVPINIEWGIRLETTFSASSPWEGPPSPVSLHWPLTKLAYNKLRHDTVFPGYMNQPPLRLRGMMTEATFGRRRQRRTPATQQRRNNKVANDTRERRRRERERRSGRNAAQRGRGGGNNRPRTQLPGQNPINRRNNQSNVIRNVGGGRS
jgi:hypothetical protein